ncbi:MAG: nuclear transport factor 2 family protein [Alphaproteobacteria bacterium]
MPNHNLKYARALEEYITFFEKLSRRSIPLLDKIAAPGMYFKDPLHEVRDIEAVKRMLAHMFKAVDRVRFKAINRGFTRKGNAAFIHWICMYERKGRAHEFEGTSMITFDEQGMITSRTDHWDAAENIYAHAPILGRIIPHVKSKIAAQP